MQILYIWVLITKKLMFMKDQNITYGDVFIGSFHVDHHYVSNWFTTDILYNNEFATFIPFVIRAGDNGKLSYLYQFHKDEYGDELLEYTQSKLDKKEVIGLVKS